MCGPKRWTEHLCSTCVVSALVACVIGRTQALAPNRSRRWHPLGGARRGYQCRGPTSRKAIGRKPGLIQQMARETVITDNKAVNKGAPKITARRLKGAGSLFCPLCSSARFQCRTPVIARVLRRGAFGLPFSASSYKANCCSVARSRTVGRFHQA